jgi:hypothetical protein
MYAMILVHHQQFATYEQTTADFKIQYLSTASPKKSYIGNFKPVAGTDAPNLTIAFFHKVRACPSQIPNRHYRGAINKLGTRL